SWWRDRRPAVGRHPPDARTTPPRIPPYGPFKAPSPRATAEVADDGRPDPPESVHSPPDPGILRCGGRRRIAHPPGPRNRRLGGRVRPDGAGDRRALLDRRGPPALRHHGRSERRHGAPRR